jgi:hypothetical protein
MRIPLQSIEYALQNKGLTDKDTAAKILLQLRLDGWHHISSPKISYEEEKVDISKYLSVNNKIFIEYPVLRDWKIPI